MNFPMKSPFLSQRSSICLYIFTGKRMPWAFTWGVNASFTPRKVQARRCHASGIAMAHRNTWWTYIKMMDLPIYLWNQGDFPVRYTKNYRSSWFGAIEWGWNHPNLGPFLSTVDVRWNWFISTTATGTMVDIWTVGWKKTPCWSIKAESMGKMSCSTGHKTITSNFFYCMFACSCMKITGWCSIHLFSQRWMRFLWKPPMAENLNFPWVIAPCLQTSWRHRWAWPIPNIYCRLLMVECGWIAIFAVSSPFGRWRHVYFVPILDAWKLRQSFWSFDVVILTVLEAKSFRRGTPSRFMFYIHNIYI